MPELRFTDLSLRSIKEPGSYWDESLPAFGLRVGKKARTFIVIRDGYRKRIGRYPSMPLQTALSTPEEVCRGFPEQ